MAFTPERAQSETWSPSVNSAAGASPLSRSRTRAKMTAASSRVTGSLGRMVPWPSPEMMPAATPRRTTSVYQFRSRSGNLFSELCLYCMMRSRNVTSSARVVVASGA